MVGCSDCSCSELIHTFSAHKCALCPSTTPYQLSTLMHCTHQKITHHLGPFHGVGLTLRYFIPTMVLRPGVFCFCLVLRLCLCVWLQDVLVVARFPIRLPLLIGCAAIYSKRAAVPSVCAAALLFPANTLFHLR